MNHLKKSQKNIQCSQSCLKVNLLAADLAEWLSPTMTLPLEYFRTTISRITLVVSGQSDGFWKPQIRPKKPFIVDVAFFNTLSLTLCKIYKNKGSLTCICLYTNRIFDSVLMRDNTDQRKLTLWHILQSVVMTKIYSTEATFCLTLLMQEMLLSLTSLYLGNLWRSKCHLTKLILNWDYVQQTSDHIMLTSKWVIIQLSINKTRCSSPEVFLGKGVLKI